MAQAEVFRLALASFDLQTGLDHVAGGGQVGGGHTGDRTGSQELDDAQLVGGGLAEEVGLQVGVRGEVDGREWHC